MRKLDPETRTTSYFCDRCDKKFAESKPLEVSTDNKVSRGVTIPLPVIADKRIEFVQKDLCGTCVRSLHAWMKKKGGTT